MAATTNPIAAPTPPPSVSNKTIHMCGLLVDVYGLAELDPAATQVSCLWLHHPRKCCKEDMGDFAARAVSAWNTHRASSSSSSSAGSPEPGLIAAAFDQRNHGSRQIHPLANEAWREGNETHAQDMFGIVSGTVVDQIGLLDAVGGYLFRDGGSRGPVVIDQHLALGVSLGGHSVWQLMFADSRVIAGVPVIGCPDYISLISDRARLSKLPTYASADSGASFIGSRDFPPALVDACTKLDPKAIFFGAGPVPPPQSSSSSPVLSEVERRRVESVLHERARGKRFLLCSGADDKLVPYSRGKSFLDWFKDAAATWLRHENVSVDDRVYSGVGHSFSVDMIADAVQFVIDVVAHGDRLRPEAATTSKI